MLSSFLCCSRTESLYFSMSGLGKRILPKGQYTLILIEWIKNVLGVLINTMYPNKEIKT